MNDKRLLQDVGEFSLLEQTVFPIARRYAPGSDLGDDCGFINIGDSLLAVSADSGPRPLIQQVRGHETDYEAAGWHAAVATASDIATAGARALFFVDTIDAPVDLPEAHLHAFLDGYFHAAAEFGFQCLGGDIRQAESLTAHVFGAGVVEHGKRIGRTGASPDDDLILIGPAGSFITAFLEIERATPVSRSEQSLQSLRFPRPKLREMRALADSHLIVAASDSSDGVLGAVENIGRRSRCGFELVLDDEHLPDTLRREARRAGYDPWNLFFFWGDWSVAVVIRHDDLGKFREVASRHSVEWRALGRATEGPFAISAIVNGKSAKVRPLRNENFLAKAFNAGVRQHVNNMLTTSLFS